MSHAAQKEEPLVLVPCTADEMVNAKAPTSALRQASAVVSRVGGIISGEEAPSSIAVAVPPDRQRLIRAG